VPYDIETDLLADDEAERIYSRFPELRSGPCPTCRDRGSYRWQGVDHDCNCQRQRQLAKHYTAAGIGDRYQRLDWTDYTGDKTITGQIVKYLDAHEQMVTQGMGLILYGPYGTGKTFIANMVLKELIKLGYSAWATTFANTIEAFTATWGDRDEKQWFARKFQHSQVLLLDDLGRELRSGHQLSLSTFDMILRTRVQNNRPTLLTTNLKPVELGTGYGAAALSLLREASLEFDFTGDDYRPKVTRRVLAELRAGETRPII
jgi:DNA replication protein DnaC